MKAILEGEKDGTRPETPEKQFDGFIVGDVLGSYAIVLAPEEDLRGQANRDHANWLAWLANNRKPTQPEGAPDA